MSLDINVYVKDLPVDLVPQIVNRLNDFDMEVEVHPEASFYNHKGFFPFCFKLKDSRFSILKEKKLISGFELYIEDFDLKKIKEALAPKPSLLQRLMGHQTKEVSFASPEIEARLKDCKKNVIFVWHTGDDFETRFATMTSAILSELVDGVCCYPADNIWYDNEDFVGKTFKELKEFEGTLVESKLKYHEFESW